MEKQIPDSFWDVKVEKVFFSILDPATKMWNFSLEDYQQLSVYIRKIFMETFTDFVFSQKYINY